VQKLQSLLGVKAFEIQGRKAILTPTGQLLYRRARVLLAEAGELEQTARAVSSGWEAEIGIAADVVFPSWLMVECLARFGLESPHTRIEVYESVLSGTAELLLQGRVQIAIASSVPAGFIGDSLMRMRFVAAAHPDHPLHKLGRPLTARDLRAHRHLVVRDTGTRRSASAVSVEVEQRWTLSHMSTSIQAARMGYGFAWYPEYRILDEIAAGTLKPLPMKEGGDRYAELYLILADPEAAGPGTRRLAQILRAAVAEGCIRAKAMEPAAPARLPQKSVRVKKKKPRG
ncbi:MAG TPA: LysR substrate-binding domain-containing protein, partial [Stenotrophobium sp.]|nr:LysR substrate-binding domain-containing protein [Stenotrophobium sp.]